MDQFVVFLSPTKRKVKDGELWGKKLRQLVFDVVVIPDET
jgi:hypothetical protein